MYLSCLFNKARTLITPWGRVSSNRETAFFLEPAKPVWSQWPPPRRPGLQGPFSIHWRRLPNAYRMERCDRSGTKSCLLVVGPPWLAFQPIRVVPATEPGTFYCTCNMMSRSCIKGGATLNSGHLHLVLGSRRRALPQGYCVCFNCEIAFVCFCLVCSADRSPCAAAYLLVRGDSFANICLSAAPPLR